MRRLFIRFIPIILILAGILWLVLGFGTYRNHKEFSQTTAVISDIQEEYNPARSEYDHRVFVQFTADGSSYEAELGAYASSYKVGKEVKISYNPADPTDIQPGGIGQSLLFLAGGAALLVGGVITLLRRGL